MLEHERFAPTTLGERLKSWDAGWLAITEARHRPDEFLRPHAHRFPAITIVREGSFGLSIGSETVDCSRTGVFFKRGEHVHSNRVGHAGSRSLILELRTDDGRPFGDEVMLPDTSFWTRDPLTLGLASNLAAEFHKDDAAAPLAREGLALELIAQLLRRGCEPRRTGSPPVWLSQVEELLREGYRAGLGLREVAAEVGRHPSHVARTFRRHHGCSPGQYARRVRLEAAARALRDTDRSLAEIAAEAGFYDQAHFGRSFRAWASVSPATYRRAHRP